MGNHNHLGKEYGRAVVLPLGNPPITLRTSALRALLTDYRQSHPRSKVTLLKYQRLENGKPVKIVEDESGLPDEDKLLSLSETVTLTTSTEVRVITEIIVASIETV